ncbi:MAG: ribonuclease H-like domain-containing protein [Dictyoglomus sp.]|nr:ribonuclease H-like domain-containing protein [Dictyoglomus sp.]MCX7942651.1 ribonuclease H-like domain-containing protein [Dictyoglomaceae bacterium]MDW8187917.1 ribonuclease H-like domain-containing protein [Dictyoglomus sp.]
MEKFRAYLDIETTGLFPEFSHITVIGIFIERGDEENLIQLVDKEITIYNLLYVLKNVGIIYTYNGSRFDLPFIRSKLNLDLKSYFSHIDLMYICWRRGLYGGLKAVERRLGIERKLKDIDGRIAVELWYRYIHHNDPYALHLLLEYNKEDVINLKKLKEKLEEL